MKTIVKGFVSMAAAIVLMAACNEQKPATVEPTLSGLDPEQFSDTINGKVTALYTLKNDSGMEVCITNFGGRVVSIMVPDRNGKMTDVVLGYDNVKQYADAVNSPSDYGASIGRYANRIANHSFSVGDVTYELVANDGTNTLHGGPTGWQYQVYDAEQIDDRTLKLTIVSPDGDNGFPGEVTAITTYTLTDDNTLDITWEATTTKETVINQTNHSYFNLNGDFSREGTNMVLYVNADNFTPSDLIYIPTGGVDHNFCLNTYDMDTYRGDDTQVAASLYSPETGIFLEVFTNEPGIQVYTGNFQGVGRDANILRKHGVKYPKHVSVCLESQKYPDTPHHPEWPTANLKPDETYRSHCAYKFSVK